MDTSSGAVKAPAHERLYKDGEYIRKKKEEVITIAIHNLTLVTPNIFQKG